MQTGVSIKRNGKGLKALSEALSKVKKFEVAIGYPKEKQGEPYPDGTPVVEVAAANVYGIGVIQRDFMAEARPQIAERAKPYLKEVGKLIAGGTNSDAKAVNALFAEIGEMGREEIFKAITEGDWPPNSDKPMSAALREKVSKSWGIPIPHGMSYLDAKMKFRGSDKPLVDTMHMANSATYIVRPRTETE